MSQKKPDGVEDGIEGWESLAEDSEGALAPNPELEAALREAAEAVESRGEKAAEPAALTLDPPPAGLEGAAGLGSEKSQMEEVEDLSAELVELKDHMLRLQADFDNFRKRALKERQEALQYGHQNLIKDLLSAVDNLDRAIEHARKSEGGDLQSLLQGVELVQREMLAVLGNHGVVCVEALGKSFDPAVHEAMTQTPDGSVSPNTIIDVFQEGYQLRDRLIRPARVVVARAPDGGDSDGGGSGD